MKGKYIRDRRLSLGWTQREMAKYFGVTIRTIQHWEKDGYNRPIITNHIKSLK